MAFENYKLINMAVQGRVAYATINNPPVNVITPPLLDEFVRLSTELAAHESLLVVVLRSANPDFFIAHFDVNSILKFPTETRWCRSIGGKVIGISHRRGSS